MLDTLLRDVRHAVRIFSQSPAFALAAVAALTLGIGVNTAIFSVVNAVLLRAAGLSPSRGARVLHVHEPRGVGYLRLARQVPALPPAGSGRRGRLRLQHRSRELHGRRASPSSSGPRSVSQEFFRLFGATPLLGRAFTADEDRPGGPHVAVLSQGLWATRFDRDPNVVGKADLPGRRALHHRGSPRRASTSRISASPLRSSSLSSSTRTPATRATTSRSAGRLKPGVTLAPGPGPRCRPRAPPSRASSQARSAIPRTASTWSRSEKCW